MTAQRKNRRGFCQNLFRRDGRKAPEEAPAVAETLQQVVAPELEIAPNDPIYELGFRVVGSTEQERIWTHVLKSLGAHFGVNEPVTLEKTCVDPKLQWSQIKNVWHNAGARSVLYTMAGPGRWMRGLMRRRGT